MTAEVEWDETELEFLLNDPHGPVGHDLERRAINVEAAAKRNLSQPGSGRIYRRRGRMHQASAPGEPPAPDTGQLRASVGHKLSEDADGLYAEIGTDVAHGLYTEVGTRHMAPRPWLRPALPAAAADE